jgi:UDP:flavonoid glycosyltransferase YjiC (YdhE family)
LSRCGCDHLTVEKLATAITSALNEEVKAKAIALGKKIQLEKGTKVATKLIIDYLEQQ